MAQRNIHILQPQSLEEALEQMLSAPHPRPLAGATVLLPSLRKSITKQQSLLALDKVLTQEIKVEECGIRIGAGATLTQLIHAPELGGSPYNLLQKALKQVASWQIRNVATIGGAVASGIPGLDSVSTLLALDARVCLQSASQKREVALKDFYIGPMQTVMDPQELITHIFLPVAPAGTWHTYFRKVGMRKAYTMPICNMAAAVQTDDTGKIKALRLTVGGCGQTSLLLHRTAAAAEGLRAAEVDLQKLEALLQEEIHPSDSDHGSEEYKRLLCRNFLREFWQRVEEGGSEA